MSRAATWWVSNPGYPPRPYRFPGTISEQEIRQLYPKATSVSTHPPAGQHEEPEDAPPPPAKPMPKALASRLETARKARDRRQRDGAVPVLADRVLAELESIPAHQQEAWIRSWAKSEGGGLLDGMRRTVAGWWLTAPTAESKTEEFSVSVAFRGTSPQPE